VLVYSSDPQKEKHPYGRVAAFALEKETTRPWVDAFIFY